MVIGRRAFIALLLAMAAGAACAQGRFIILFQTDGGAVGACAVGGVFEHLDKVVVGTWDGVISHGVL